MAVLYVTKAPCVVRVSFGVVLVTSFSEKDKPDSYTVLQECKAALLEAIIVWGKVQVTSDAVRFCLRNGIDLAYFDTNGFYLGKLESHVSKCSDLKLIQYKLYLNSNLRLNYAKQLVKGKVINQIATLRYFAKNNVDLASKLSPGISLIETMYKQIDLVKDINELLGFEGSIARKYFEFYGVVFIKDLVFICRTHRPAKDPVNSLMSLGYVILTNVINGILIARGFEPTIGIVHEPYSNRPALALDLVEEFRSVVVDRFVVKLCNLGVFKENMFYKDEQGGYKLKDEYCRIFFKNWEEFINKPIPEAGTNIDQRKNVRELICQQVDILAMAIRQNIQYNHFKFKA